MIMMQGGRNAQKAPFLPRRRAGAHRAEGKQPAADFFDTADYRKYLGWLKEGSERYGCTIHAYVLMINHVHLLATPGDSDAVSRMMQYVCRRYVPYINHAYG